MHSVISVDSKIALLTKALGLVEYKEPKDIKRSYPNILMVQVNSSTNPLNGQYYVIAVKDIPEIIKKYNTRVNANGIPKRLGVGSVNELRFWIPTKVKILDDVRDLVIKEDMLIY